MVLKEDLKKLMRRTKSMHLPRGFSWNESVESFASSIAENMSWRGVMKCVNVGVRKGELLVNRPVNMIEHLIMIN